MKRRCRETGFNNEGKGKRNENSFKKHKIRNSKYRREHGMPGWLYRWFFNDSTPAAEII
jgi:hypothetical protein